MSARHFTDLEVWRVADELDTDIMRLVKELPPEETLRLGDQMIRAVRSIPANISEGFCRRGYKEKAQFYSISEGSCASGDILAALSRLKRVQQMLCRLIRKTLEADFRTKPLPEPPKPPRPRRPHPGR